MMFTANTFSKGYDKNETPFIYEFLSNNIILLRILAFITIQ